jgi:hypothetical protein
LTLYRYFSLKGFHKGRAGTGVGVYHSGGPEYEIYMMWIPSHVGVRGDEWADQLADGIEKMA